MQVVDVVGVSPYLREKEARFLVEVERAAGGFKVLQPEDTDLVCDPSPQYRDSLLFIEAHLRRSVPTDAALVVGHRAAMDALPYQLLPAAKALAMPRQRLLIADAVGLGKTLECGILCSELIRRGRGRRLLVVTSKSMLVQFQKETLILLSATPHDGKPESFASLMTMLDPTAIADPSRYSKDDIRDLYVRRFRKDVIADLRNSVKERDSADVECVASEREERVFALLKDLKLPDSDGKAKAGQLFKTTLAKSLLSSPMAALETVRNRLKRLEAGASSSDSPASTDRAALQSLEPLLAAITPADFSKYQRLLQLIRDDWSWSGKDPTDRIVLFTGRRETQRFLVEHLAADLGLPKAAVVGLDGAMPDVEQTRVVEQFAQEQEAVRILVATEVASEGLNLHYLSHRLVHVDIPWSLMTLQQRNGRIDRYGEARQPMIRYLLNASRSEGMGDAEKVVRLLREKDKQAQLNIGDPAVFLGVYDAAAEEELISRAYEAGTLKDLNDRMEVNAEPQRQASSGDQLFEELFGISADAAESGGIGSGGGNGNGSGDGDGPAPAGNPTPVEAHTRQSFSLFPSLWGYVDTAPDAVAQQMERRGDKLDLRVFPEQQRLEITPPSDLQRRYDRYPRELQPPRGQRLALSTEPAALQRALEQSRRQDNSRPELEYLWDLHPLMDWLADRGQITFPRHHAPVLQLSDGIDPGAVVMVFQGTIPNQKGVPVVQEWVAVRFAGTGLKVVAVEPFEAVATRLQLGSRDLANISGEEPPEHLAKQLPFAVEQANTYLRDCGEQWTARVQPELEAQRERLRRLRGRQVEQLELSLAANQRPQQIKDKHRQEKQKAIDGRFEDHERFVSQVMTIDPAPYLKLVAVLHREA
jgi:hypothetical protein